MSQKVIGDSSVKFGIEGASQSLMGIVESVSIATSPDTVLEAWSEKGDYETGKSEVKFQGERSDITVSGYCKDTTLPSPGDSLVFTKPTNFKSSLPTGMYVVSAEVTGQQGDFIRCSITGIAHKGMN